MHIHLGLAGIILILIGVVLISVFGWPITGWGFLVQLLLIPVAVIAATALAWYLIHWLSHRRERRRRQVLAMQRRIAKLEAEQGIPLMTEGACPQCGKPLLTGAHFCSYCKAPTPRTALVCATCGTRNAGDAIWCGACGTPLAEEDAELVPRRRSVSTFIATLLDSALER